MYIRMYPVFSVFFEKTSLVYRGDRCVRSVYDAEMRLERNSGSEREAADRTTRNIEDYERGAQRRPRLTQLSVAVVGGQIGATRPWCWALVERGLTDAAPLELCRSRTVVRFVVCECTTVRRSSVGRWTRYTADSAGDAGIPEPEKRSRLTPRRESATLEASREKIDTPNRYATSRRALAADQWRVGTDSGLDRVPAYGGAN